MELFTEFEYRWARWNDVDPRGMVVCNSGTSALHLAFECLELPPGSNVVMSDYNMVACPRAVVLAGLRPVFTDCDKRLLLDGDDLHRVVYDHYDGVGNSNWKEGKLISACLVTQVYGREVKPYDVRKPTESLNISIVEDLAEAHGVRPSYNADAATWSFYRNKIVAGEEGGAVWFSNPLRAKMARRMRSLGFKDENDYTHTARGHNYRLCNVLAAKIDQSLQKYEDNYARRRDAEAWYDEMCPPEWRQPERQAPWVYDLRIRGLFREDQGRIVSKLREAGIEARCGFKPMTWQEEFKAQAAPYEAPPSEAAKAAHEVFYLPLTPGAVSRASVKTCFDMIGKALGK